MLPVVVLHGSQECNEVSGPMRLEVLVTHWQGALANAGRVLLRVFGVHGGGLVAVAIMAMQKEL